MSNSRKHLHTIMFKPTCDCNLNCTYCYDKPNRELHKGQVASQEIIEHTAKIMSEYAENVNWYWHGGEVTILGTDYLRNAQRTLNKFYKSNFKQMLQSNGIIPLTDPKKWIDLANETGIGIGFSFDLYGQSERLGKDIDITTDYEDMVEAFVTDGINTTNEAITVITNKTIDKLIPTYEHFKTRFGGLYVFHIMFVFEIDEVNPTGLGITAEDYIKYYPPFLEHTINDNSKDALLDNYTASYIMKLLGSDEPTLCSFIDCRRKWLSVHPDGRITHCDREPGEYYKLGNIMDYSNIGDIYKSEGYKQFEADYAERLANYCYQCNFYGLCKGGCPSNHGAVNQTRANKCNERECYTQQHNLISSFVMLSQIKDRELVNQKVIKLLNKYDARTPHEVIQEVTKLGYTIPELDIHTIHNYPQEFINSIHYKLFNAFKDKSTKITQEEVDKLL